MDSKGFAVAIDGPVGVGKSTTARMVAEKLGFAYIDTGAMYRTVALYMFKQGVDLADASAVEKNLPAINIHLSQAGDGQHVYLNERDVTREIRTQYVSEGASVVAAHRAVREKLVAQQKKMAETGCVVMDGRDIGSQVLPWAQVKIYLDADVEIRANRRILDLQNKGQPTEFEKVLEETKIRDHRDKNRTESPLIQTEDAIRIDTGQKSIKEVTDTIVEIVKRKENQSCSINS